MLSSIHRQVDLRVPKLLRPVLGQQYWFSIALCQALDVLLGAARYMLGLGLCIVKVHASHIFGRVRSHTV